MQYQTHQLSNGIRLIHKPDNASVSYCGLAINTGTRDEKPNEQGLAHFIEHMLFKGTKKRRSGHIINRLESVGGELNAYTNKEETVIYAAILNEDFERAMDLIADIVFNSTFPDNEIKKEKEIILDEIQSYNDSPSELIYDDFEALIFQGSSLGHAILGEKKGVKKYTRKNIQQFIAENYHPEEMVFFSLGNLNFKKIIRQAEKYLVPYPASSALIQREPPALYIPKQVSLSKDTHQLHIMVGNRAYSQNHPDKMALYLLNNILGGPGMNSLLNLSLREKNGLAYHVESSYAMYSDTGIFSIYAGSDPKNEDRCMSLIFKEIKKMKEITFSDLKLSKYKKQLMGQLTISNENKESVALGLGKSFLHKQLIETSADVRKKLDNITPKDLQRIANELFEENQLTSLIYK